MNATSSVVDFSISWDAAIRLASLSVIRARDLPPLDSLQGHGHTALPGDLVVVLEDLAVDHIHAIRSWFERQPDHEFACFARIEWTAYGAHTERSFRGLVFAFVETSDAEIFRAQWSQPIPTCVILPFRRRPSPI